MSKEHSPEDYSTRSNLTARGKKNFYYQKWKASQKQAGGNFLTRKDLAVKTPSHAMKGFANARHAELHFYYDNFSGEPRFTQDKVSADHNWPVASILKHYPGVAKLDTRSQDYLLNHPMNTVAMPAGDNQNKGDQDPMQWSVPSVEGGRTPIHPDIGTMNAARVRLYRDEIERVLTKNKLAFTPHRQASPERSV